MEECKEEKRIKEDIRKGNNETEVSVPFSKFPLTKWIEWKKDCETNFNDCRWYKAYADHLKAKNSNENEMIWQKIAELEAKLNQLTEHPKEQKKETIKTLGGEIEVD